MRSAPIGQPSLIPRPTDAFGLALFILAYVATGKLALQLAFLHASATAVWPPTGLALGVLLVFGSRFWPGIFLGAFLVNVTTAGSPLTSLAIASGNTLEALLGAALIHRYADGPAVFQRPQNVLRFVLMAGMGSPLVSAACGVTSLALLGYAPWSEYASIWLTWWLGDASGALIVTPAVVLWALQPRAGWTKEQRAELALLLVSLLVVSEIVFGDLLSLAQKQYPTTFLLIPVLLWSAFRFSPREAATLIVISSGLAVWGTLEGLGPFARDPRNEALLLLQVFNAVVAMMTMALSAGIAEQKRTELALRHARETLEERVMERTARLADANAALRHEIEKHEQTEEALRRTQQELVVARQLAETALQRTHDTLEVAQQAARVGTFEWDLMTNELKWSESGEALYGLQGGSFSGRYESWTRYICPDDLPAVEEAVRGALEDGQSLDIVFRIRRADGQTRWLTAKGRMFCDEQGRPERMVGLNQDITEEKAREEQLQQLVRDLEASRAELQEKIADLEQFSDVVVGRELKMMELEKEVEALRQQLAAPKHAQRGTAIELTAPRPPAFTLAAPDPAIPPGQAGDAAASSPGSAVEGHETEEPVPDLVSRPYPRGVVSAQAPRRPANL